MSIFLFAIFCMCVDAFGSMDGWKHNNEMRLLSVARIQGQYHYKAEEQDLKELDGFVKELIETQITHRNLRATHSEQVIKRMYFELLQQAVDREKSLDIWERYVDKGLRRLMFLTKKREFLEPKDLKKIVEDFCKKNFKHTQNDLFSTMIPRSILYFYEIYLILQEIGPQVDYAEHPRIKALLGKIRALFQVAELPFSVHSGDPKEPTFFESFVASYVPVGSFSEERVLALYEELRKDEPYSVFYNRVENNIVGRLKVYGLRDRHIQKLLNQGRENTETFFKWWKRDMLSDIDEQCRRFVLRLSPDDFASLQKYCQNTLRAK